VQTLPNPAAEVEAQEAVKNDPLALKPIELANFVEETRREPAWRRQANIEADYYDGNQADTELLDQLEALGIAWAPENIVGPTIDSVLGLEAKTRLDWQVKPSKDKKYQDVAEALNVRLNEAERETNADRAQSDAYAGQIKTGLGWVEVGRESDPFAPSPYRVESVHRNEIFWDWKSRKPDLSDARYLIRKRWYDVDVAALAFPDYADVLKGLANGLDELSLIAGYNSPMRLDTTGTREWPFDEGYHDSVAKRVCIYECWYRRWVREKVLRLPNKRVVEYDPESQLHQKALQMGARLEEAIFPKVRVAFYVGPYPMMDIPSPYQHRHFPYVPFWGRREDLTNVPYGLIRPMKPMQDEVNARNSKQIWLLSAKRITMTEDATVDDVETVRQEVNRPDAVIVLQKAALQAGGVFKVETDFALAGEQYKVLVDKRQALKNVAGVYAAFEGQNSNATSGIALDTLVEQSTQTLAVINSNQRYARQQVGDLLLSLIVEDIGKEQQTITVETPGKPAREVTINEVLELDNGEKGLNNGVQQAMLKVSLSDVPSTSSYRKQRLMQLTELTKALPPQIQALVIDFVIGATDDPAREAIMDRLRSKLQLDDGSGNAQLPKTPEQLQQIVMQAVQEAVGQAGQAFEIALKKKESAQKDRELDIREDEAKTKRIVAAYDAETRRKNVTELGTFKAETDRLEVENKDEHDTLNAGLQVHAAMRAIQLEETEQVPGATQSTNTSSSAPAAPAEQVSPASDTANAVPPAVPPQPPTQPSDTGLGAS
jgi:hypothetical protein